MHDARISIFLSYSHEDEKLCKGLQKHLIQLERTGLISTWHDRKLTPGCSWDETIKSNLQTSDMVLFLVSAAFLYSEYIYENELNIALKQHYAGKCLVVPIILKKCDIELTPFSSIQCLPRDLEPVCSKKWHSKDNAFFDIVHSLKEIIYREKEKKKIRADETEAWNNATRLHTPSAYAEYIKKSPLKTYLEEALQGAGIDGDTDYKQKFEIANLELELERRKMEWIVMELHDNIGQRLSVVKLLLSCHGDTEYKETAKSTEKTLLDTILDLYDIYRPLKYKQYNNSDDGSPTDFDLKQSITTLISIIGSTGNIAIDTELKNLDQLSDVFYKKNVLRLVQELLHNVLKHAKATKVRVIILNDISQINICVTDNGIGMPDGSTEKAFGMGLNNIKSRITIFKGTFTISTPIKGGCEVNIKIPKA